MVQNETTVKILKRHLNHKQTQTLITGPYLTSSERLYCGNSLVEQIDTNSKTTMTLASGATVVTSSNIFM